MPGLGTVFVELQLDRSKFNTALQTLEKDATAVPLQIEKSFQNLGIKSSYQFDLLRQKAVLNYDAIRSRAESTANDILRAEQAKNAQLASLNEQQYGKQVSFLDRMKSHWLAVSAAIFAAQRIASEAFSMAKDAADYQERINSLDALGRQAGLTGEQIVAGMKDASRGLLSLKESADLASSALNLNLSAQQMIGFTKIAESLTDVIGGTIPEAFNRLTVAAASGRTQTLAQMGIIVDLDEVYKRYAVSVNKTVQALGEAEKQQARIIAIYEAAKEKTDALGESTDTAADKMERAGVIIKDLSLRVGEQLARAFVGVYDTMAPVNRRLAEQREVVGGVTASFDAYLGTLQKLAEVSPQHLPTILPDTTRTLTTRPAPMARMEWMPTAEQAKAESDYWVERINQQKALDEKLLAYTNANLEADRKLRDEKIKNLRDVEKEHTAAYEKALAEVKRYADEVKKFDREIRDTRRETADMVADLQQSGMTPAEAAADKERRANEALADALTKSGQEQVDALRRVQAAYKDLGTASVRSATEQKESAKQAWATDRPMDDWRTTAGKHSEAFKQAWGQTTPGGVGSAEWWAGKGNTYWGAASETSAPQSAAEKMAAKVQEVGDLIVQAQEQQRDAATSSARQAERLADSMTAAATEAARLADALANAQVQSQPPGGGVEVGALGQLVKRTGMDFIRRSDMQAAADDIVSQIRGGGGESGYSGGNYGTYPSGGGADGGYSGISEEYADGGVVPGPRGVARRATVHGGEVILNDEQQAGGATIVIQLDGRSIAQAVKVPMQDLIRAGQIQIRAN